MIIGSTFADLGIRGERVPTVKAHFASQAEQVVFLRKLVDVYRNRSNIRQKAVEILRGAGVPSKAKLEQAKTIGNWVRDHIYYVMEPEETFQTPTRTIEAGFGDCDDMTTLIASLIEAVGIPARIVGIGVRAPVNVMREIFRSAKLTHIFPCAMIGRVCVPLDATIKYPMGTDPIAVAKSKGARVNVFAV